MQRGNRNCPGLQNCFPLLTKGERHKDGLPARLTP